MNTSQKNTPKLPMIRPDGRTIGLVEEVQFTYGGAGKQWTTISGVRYATFWDFKEKNWKEGDVVEFQSSTTVLFHGSLPVPSAVMIRKFDLSAADHEDWRMGAVFVNRRQHDAIVAGLRLLAKSMANAEVVAGGGDVGGATCVELNDGDIGSIMTCEGAHRGLTAEEVHDFCDAILNGPAVDWSIQPRDPQAVAEGMARAREAA